jgi:myosin heavy subunit
MMAEFDSDWEHDLSALDRVLQSEREMAKQIEELRRELATDREVDWEEQKSVQELSNKASQLEQELDQLAEKMEERVQDAAQRKLMSLDMLQKMIEAQELFEEVATQEMRDAQKRLQEALEKMDQGEMEKALEDMALSQEDMLRRLERTIAYLKKLKAEQQVDALVRKLEEMLEQQNALNQQANESTSENLPNLAPPQDRMAERFEEFAAEAAASEQELQEANIAQPSLISEFCQSPSKSSAPGKMKKTAEKMNSKNKQGAGESGTASSEEIDELLQKMKALQEEMNRDNQKEMAEALRKALDDALYLSDKQEDLMTDAGDVDPSSLSLREMAAEQEALRQATEQLAGQMQELSKKSSCMSNSAGAQLEKTLDQMKASAQCLSDRQGPQAGRKQREALSGLNQLAGQIMDGMDKNDKQCENPGQCDNPGDGGQAKMGQLSQQQGRLNQQMPQPGQSGSSMSEAERETLSRMKSEQQAIKQGIDELASEIGDEENHLGRLDKLAEEMQKVVEDMERSNVSAATHDRQRRIYARMLDFQHALQKQDYKDQRRARQGQFYRSVTPDPLGPTGGLTDEEYQKLLTRYQEEGFPAEYEESIKAYFRALIDERGRR